jgi:hypothetical protein
MDGETECDQEEDESATEIFNASPPTSASHLSNSLQSDDTSEITIDKKSELQNKIMLMAKESLVDIPRSKL